MNWQRRKTLLYLISHPKINRSTSLSFSQEAEDIIIDNLLGFKRRGFYIDFGAYHPYVYSNTLKFYARGWNGINIDATPGSMNLFNKWRPRDVNIECGVADKEGEMIYYQFDEPGLNSFDESLIKHCEESGYKLVAKTKVRVKTPMQILDEYVPSGQTIDFVDIDIEGYDDLIVNMIDWKKYRPSLIVMEKKADNRISNKGNDTLIENGYFLLACTSRTAIYKADMSL